MPKRLYLAWQDAESRRWHTFARLDRTRTDYELMFTRGVAALRTLPYDLFKLDPRKRYKFSELIPIFQNRLPSQRRSDFARMADWLNLRGDEDEFTLLSRFGLIPGTDSILIYPEPETSEGQYTLDFFVHGVRHMVKDAEAHCNSLLPGERILPVLDVQNPFDKDAVAVRPEQHPILLGYVPTFYATDLRNLLGRPEIASAARLSVLKCNRDAPTQLRLLCRFEAALPADFRALNTEAHDLMVDWTKDSGPDRDNININDEYEVRYWTKRLGVSRERLFEAVRKAGNASSVVQESIGSKTA